MADIYYEIFQCSRKSTPCSKIEIYNGDSFIGKSEYVDGYIVVPAFPDDTHFNYEDFTHIVEGIRYWWMDMIPTSIRTQEHSLLKVGDVEYTVGKSVDNGRVRFIYRKNNVRINYRWRQDNNSVRLKAHESYELNVREYNMYVEMLLRFVSVIDQF